MFFQEEDVIEIHGLQLEEFLPNAQMMAGRLRHLDYRFGIPTHTEDDIPIRKLYVSNLPQKTSRSDLFGVFAPYGFIKSCWIRLSEPRGPNGVSSPTYAFVTYSKPEDAHKALMAPYHEKCLKGKQLKVFPADSWHQPIEDCYGNMHWNRQSVHFRSIHNQSNSDDGNSETNEAAKSDGAVLTSSMGVNVGATTSTDKMETEEQSESEPTYTILEVLNIDCLHNILSYVSISDIIRSERVSKAWQSMVQEYLDSTHTYKTSWWQHTSVTLTTAVLRRLLARVGRSLTRLHIDHSSSALNDRTAHSIGKFCPNLEELMVSSMHTKNWNPLIYGCRQLKSLSFLSCDKITDSSLMQLDDSVLESFTISNNSLVTGLFLSSSPKNLQSLSFINCMKLQDTVLCTAFSRINNLTTLRMDACCTSVWKIIPQILKRLRNLEELSLSEYLNEQEYIPPNIEEEFNEAFATLTKLQELKICRNVHVNDSLLKVIGQHCSDLRALDVSSCNPILRPGGVGDEGVAAVCRGCSLLRRLDVSYLARLTEAGVRAVAAAHHLVWLAVRGYNCIRSPPLALCLQLCHNLQELDVCGCDLVSEELVSAASVALDSHPRPLLLRLAMTPVTLESLQDFRPLHKLLRLDFENNRCLPHLRPDFTDRLINDDSDDYESLDDLYDHDEDFGFGSEDDMFDVEDDFLDEVDELLYPDFVFL